MIYNVNPFCLAIKLMCYSSNERQRYNIMEYNWKGYRIDRCSTFERCYKVPRVQMFLKSVIIHLIRVLGGVVTPTDRPKSVRNRCLFELFCGVVCVVTLPFGHFCWCRGFCHRTGSDLLLFVSTSYYMHISINLLWSLVGWLVEWLFNVTCNDSSVIYVTAYRCAGGLKKKLDLRSGSKRHRHFVWFFNVPV